MSLIENYCFFIFLAEFIICHESTTHKKRRKYHSRTIHRCLTLVTSSFEMVILTGYSPGSVP